METIKPRLTQQATVVGSVLLVAFVIAGFSVAAAASGNRSLQALTTRVVRVHPSSNGLAEVTVGTPNNNFSQVGQSAQLSLLLQSK